MARDLRKDLEICNAATPGRWEAWSFDCSDEGEEPKTGLWVTSEHQPDSAICTFGVNPTEQDYHNARFIAAAREGWSHAIRRAMEAETRLQELWEAAGDVLCSLRASKITAAAMQQEPVVLEVCRKLFNVLYDDPSGKGGNTHGA